MATKRVLIISYYFPPSGGAGVQRVLKTVKYLRDFGWEPVVYTAENAAYPVLDPSLAEEVPADVTVLRGPIWEPYELYKRFTGQGKKKRVYSGIDSGEQQPSWTQRASVWIRGNFFIPDARAPWIGPSLRWLNDWLGTNSVDAMISSGPPHTTHMIARGLKQKFGIPWIADFRDPWTNIDFYHRLQLSKWADRRHRNMEASVLREADRVVTVSWSWAEDFRDLGRQDTEVITNGFDEADFPNEEIAPDPGFTIVHVGYINKDRNHEAVWRAIGELCREESGFASPLTLRFTGQTDPGVAELLRKYDLLDHAVFNDYVPHREVIRELKRARVLLLLTNDTPNVLGVVPGKIYEYLATGRPVLGIGVAEGDAARVLNETGAGTMCGFTDTEAVKQALRTYFAEYREGKLPGGGDPDAIRRFTRREATRRTADLLDQITAA